MYVLGGHLHIVHRYMYYRNKNISLYVNHILFTNQCLATIQLDINY